MNENGSFGFETNLSISKDHLVAQHRKPGNFCGSLVTHSHLAYILEANIFPALMLVGVLGNALILVVLRSRALGRSRSTHFLSAMALMDLLFFPVMLMLSMKMHLWLMANPWLSYFYFYWLKIPFTLMANALLTSSAW